MRTAEDCSEDDLVKGLLEIANCLPGVNGEKCSFTNMIKRNKLSPL